jgi:DcaP outer membrane protein
MHWGRRWKTVALSIGIAVFWVGCLGGPAWAQKKSKSLSSQVAEQKRQLEDQLLELEAQKALADSQAVRIEGLEKEIAALQFRLSELEREMGRVVSDSLLEARLQGIEAATKKAPELPPDIVSAGDFPGSIRIPGTDAAMKFGARVRTAVVLTLDPLGTDDRFLTNSIPVGDVAVSGEEKRTNISARASRLNFEFRTPIGKQEVRAFFEGDFAGAGNTFRLRHAYAQFAGFIVGQTWSTFSDPWVNLEDLDFEGVSSENLTRQPQLRYWWTEGTQTRIAVAVETPEVSLTGGSGVNLMPDLIARVFQGLGETGHVQVAGLLRQVRGEATPGDVRSDVGWGLSASGVFPFRFHYLEDRIIFQVNGGEGIARYINDLSSQSGMDAVFDTTTGELNSIPALGWYVAYEHAWKEWKGAKEKKLRSTALWSFVDVHNFDFQPPDAYKKTHRVAVNLVFSPGERVDVGLEYIYGTRENKNNQTGSANQFQLVTLIRF